MLRMMKSVFRPLALLAALLPFAAMARAEQYDKKPPSEVLKAMPPGAISVAYQSLKIGPKQWPAALHISVAPKPGLDYVAANGTPVQAGTSKTRKEILILTSD